MSKPEHNDKNIDLLANEITESMDISTLQQTFYENQRDYHKNDREAFEADWQYSEMEAKMGIKE